MQGATSIPFRNVFPRETDFSFTLDNPAFSLGRVAEKLGPKKSTSICVTFKPDGSGAGGGRAGSAKQQQGQQQQQQATSGGGTSTVEAAGGSGFVMNRTARLVVSCPKQTQAQWVYYLSA